VWTLFLLGLARIVPIIAIAPFLGGKILADPMKVGFGIALTPIFFPYLLMNAHGSIPLDVHFALLLAKEVIVGSMLGFLASIPFYFTTDAGTLIDHQRGSQSLQVTDPSTQIQSSPTGLLFNNILVALFFTIGGPFLFFDAIYSSYQVIPVDKFFNDAFFNLKNPLWAHVVQLLNTMLSIAIQLSAPSLIALLMSDLFLGIANRMAPQVQISFLLWSLKAYVGIGILWAGWWVVFRQMESQSLGWIKLFHKMIQSLGIYSG
jgi:type III secretion protein SpaR/YscT/HrcT